MISGIANLLVEVTLKTHPRKNVGISNSKNAKYAVIFACHEVSVTLFSLIVRLGIAILTDNRP